MPQKSDYFATFEANCVSAPKINLTDWTPIQTVCDSKMFCKSQPDSSRSLRKALTSGSQVRVLLGSPSKTTYSQCRGFFLSHSVGGSVLRSREQSAYAKAR